MNIFCNFFGIFYYGSGGNPSERFFFLFYLFLCLSQPILAWKEVIMFFFLIFWIFFLFFWNFLFRVRLELIGTIFFFFIFSLSWHFLTYFGLKRSYDSVFEFFEFFCFYFWNFPFRVREEHIGMIFYFYFLYFSAFYNLFWPEMKL